MPIKTIKIVIAGPYGAGKTTFVKTLSEVLPIETDVPITKESINGKRSTTVAFDYGRMKVREDLVVHLFGIPGQERFSFMWKIIARGMHGYLFIVDSSSEERVKEALGMYNFFRENFPSTPHVVAANKQDVPTAVDIPTIKSILKIPYEVKVMPLIATNRRSALFVLVTLLEEIRSYLLEMSKYKW
ncbi:ATP/GTP-binding protein [Vulcanisaeta sp. JCM 16161]|uniref:GTP-binding protein n=1 Tax=Vulcanisaeta sp. JCM 16161 TaxID=1295372 RepID=UPI0006D08332|nr:ATP/GTP-binding protein [Vulcanisaeta sp. JCM 16161]